MNGRISPSGGTPRGRSWPRRRRLYFSGPLEMGGLPGDFTQAQQMWVSLLWTSQLQTKVDSFSGYAAFWGKQGILGSAAKCYHPGTSLSG